MTTPNPTSANAKKIALIKTVLNEVLNQSLRHGFFGKASVEFSINDGTIQHIRHKLESEWTEG